MAALGDLLVAGEGFPLDADETATGGLILGGTALTSSTMPTTWTEAASGGVLLGGTAPNDRSVISDYVATGGMTLAGTASISMQVGIATEPDALSATLPALTADLTALGGSIATISASLPLLQAELTGSVIKLAATLPALTGALTARAGSIATINAVLPALAGIAGGENPVVGALNATFPALTAQSEALTGSIAALSATLPALNATLSSALGVSGTIAATLPALSATLSSAQQASATIEASLPALTARLTGSVSASWVDALCMNTRTTAVTRFTNYHFNSFARVGERYYAAGPDGVFQIDVGTTDNGTAIDAVFTTGLMDFGSQYLKRSTHLYAALRSDTSMRVSVTPDEGKTIDYLLDPVNAGALEQRRKILAAGPRGRYWQFEVANVDGGAFEIDELSAMVGDTGRRV